MKTIKLSGMPFPEKMAKTIIEIATAEFRSATGMVRQLCMEAMELREKQAVQNDK